MARPRACRRVAAVRDRLGGWTDRWHDAERPAAVGGSQGGSPGNESEKASDFNGRPGSQPPATTTAGECGGASYGPRGSWQDRTTQPDPRARDSKEPGLPGLSQQTCGFFQSATLLAFGTARTAALPPGAACRHCGLPIDWRCDGVAFADGSGAHLACYESAP